jgi:hypothetical protein
MRHRCDTARTARRLVDEHQPVDIDVRLKGLPCHAFCHHVWPVLFAGVRRLTMARRSKERRTTLGTKRSPCAANRWSAISASVMSGVLSTRATSSAACASIVAECWSPPCRRAR